MISPHKTPALAKMAMLLLFAIGAVAVLGTNTISAQELGRTITSPFGIARQTSTSESGSDGDTFVDPETGEVGHIIRNPFGVANPNDVDTGIDIPDSGEEEVGGIITSPFGVPASDDIDTGVDVFDEDEEYLISLPDDEESDAENSEDVDEVDDETSDDEKEIGEESYEATTEKYVPVIDNPIRGVEFDSIITFSGTSTYTVESETNDINNAPTLYVHAGGNFVLTLTANQDLSTNIQPIFRKLNQSGTQNPFEPIQSGSNPPYSFVYYVPSTMYGGTYCASISCTFNGVQIERVLKIKIVFFELKIDYNNDRKIDDNDIYPPNYFGKIIHINNLDVDNDGIPDFADGYESYGYNNGISNSSRVKLSNQQNFSNGSLPFTDMIVRVSKALNEAEWHLNFVFNESDHDVNYYEISGENTRTYEPRGEGTLRLWTKNGNIERSVNPVGNTSDYGDRIPSLSSNNNINKTIPLTRLTKINQDNTEIDYYEYVIYIEAVKPLVNTAVSGETITVSLRKNDNTSVRFSDSIVATSYQVVFEGITNDEIAGSHVIYNPCGIIKKNEESGESGEPGESGESGESGEPGESGESGETGETAKFHFDTIPSGIPCTTVNFNWRASDNLTFVGGNTGKSVTVCATGEGDSDDFSLIIDIGRGDNFNPSIKGKILEETTVKLFVWVVTDTNGNNPAFQRSKIDSWLDDVNQIYKQVGIKFEIDTTDGFNYIPETSYQIIETRDEGRNLVAYPQDPQHPGCPRVKDGLEVFFVKKMTFARGLSIPRDGIIIPEMKSHLNDINYLTLAHELGHACGLHDIYHSKTRKTPPYTTYSINNDINVNSLWIKNDCTYEEIPSNATMSVAGYYKNDLKHIKLLERLMMFGYGANASGTLYKRRDFSRGDVYGVDMNCISHDVKTGLEGMVRNPQHDR